MTPTQSERSAALLVLARQFELASERVVPPGCADSYVVAHVKFGTRIMITLSGAKGQRDATAMGMDDVPAVYSQMVRSLLRGQPMEAPGVVDRTNVSATQSSPPNRTHTDAVWYARLGYGAHFGDETYGGPSVGFLGYRREGNRFGIDVSFLNFQSKSSDRTYSYYSPQGSSGMTGTWLKLEGLRYFSPAADRSPYIGAGLSWGTANFDHDNTSWEGDGLQGELTGGFEMGRSGSIHVFVRGGRRAPVLQPAIDDVHVRDRASLHLSIERDAPVRAVIQHLAWSGMAARRREVAGAAPIGAAYRSPSLQSGRVASVASNSL